MAAPRDLDFGRPRHRRTIGEVAAEHWKGWRLLVFTSNAMLAKKVGLRVARKTPFFNGALECHLWEFQT